MSETDISKDLNNPEMQTRRIELIKRSRIQFLLFGLIPLCVALVLGGYAKSNANLSTFTTILIIPFFVMTWIFSKALGLKNWQAALILLVMLIFQNIAIFLIATLVLIGKSLEMTKARMPADLAKFTDKPHTLEERFAADRQRKP